jgi:alkanesulfonate monooxygenase SsuD/methylene tetrahydromethanopterin reductase-like flavin-dependent oxidoreductase (luciferase family)
MGQDSCAVGSTATCAEKLAEFRAAGADEIAIYTSTPAQNADVIAAWRSR